MLDEKDFTVFVGDMLRKQRREQHKTLEDIAWESGLDYSTVNLIENGKQQTKAYTLYKLLYALNIDLQAFFGAKSTRSEEALLLDKIKMLDDEHINTLLKFLNSFELNKK